MHSIPVRIISAGAGSGKTHRLTQELGELIGKGKKVTPEHVVATTFTRKAAAELAERLRQDLFKAGFELEANRMATSFIGTVNSVCGRFLQHLAFEAGISPHIEVIVEEDQQVLFNQAISAVLDDTRVTVLDQIAERFGFGAGWDKRNWLIDLKNIIDAARSNDISPMALKSCSSQSLQGLLALLPPASKINAEELDQSLMEALAKAIQEIHASDDQTRGTQTYLNVLEEAEHRLRQGTPIPWAQWSKLAKEKPTKRSEQFAEPVRKTAAQHPSHPRLRQDIASFVETLFTLAADAMEHYQGYKQERGLMDFVDQESLLLRALETMAVRNRLQDELEVLLVDEFQDTSPIQLALFLKLAEMSRQSIWVGDPKQSIFAFRGADPALMDAVVNSLGEMRGGDIQKFSYRSRPELVRFVNALFVPALADMLPEERVALIPQRPDPPGAAAPLRSWVLDGSNKELRAAQLAAGITDLIAEAPVIHDKPAGCDRKARAGDIAVLCRTNEDCGDLAHALAARGVKVAISRSGLLRTPEGKLALACLRLFLNERDTLATAEIQVLTDPEPKPEVWCQERLDHLQAGQPSHEWCQDHAVIRNILAIARRATAFSPSEALDELIEAMDMRRLLMGWGEAERRLGNLEKLRSMARDYEDSCRRQTGAASVGGYLLWLQGLANGKEDGQAEGYGPDAVNVLTCHSAKGLEWPIVIAHNLDKSPRERIWGLSVIDGRSTIDLTRPLAERWLRYWPWPYGTQQKDTGLQEKLDVTPELAKATQSAEAEELRLLYVTLTRARDYQVLCLNRRGNPWLEMALNKAKLSLPLPPTDGEVQLSWNGEGTPLCLQVTYPSEPMALAGERPAGSWVAERSGVKEFPPARLSPSKMELAEGILVMAAEPLVIGERVGINGKPAMDQLGTALHGFIAADRGGIGPHEERLSMLQGILDRHGVSGTVDARAVIRNADAFYRCMIEKFNQIKIMTEWPVYMLVGNQRVVGNVDMILDTPQGWVVIDHKSFPGGATEWKSEAASYGAQFKAYVEAIEKASGRKVAACFVHFLIGGGIVGINFRNIS